MTRLEARKRAEVMRAYADGAEVEWRETSSGDWVHLANPNFNSFYEYRIKPERQWALYTFRTFPRSAAWLSRDAGRMERIIGIHDDGISVWNGGVSYSRLLESRNIKIFDHEGKVLPKGVEVTS